MTELKRLPEQRPLHDDWDLSKEFRELIENVPVYTGVLLENGETVELGYAKGKGYESNIPLKYFLRGLPYALAIHKGSSIYVPKGLKARIKEEIDEIFDDVKLFAKRVIEYEDLKKLYEELKRSDRGKCQILI